MRRIALILTLLAAFAVRAERPVGLHVEGRWLKNPQGETVNLHGFGQTYSPWFNEQGSKWNNYNVAACLKYNKEKIDQILAAGWKMDFVRMHMDPYWSNTPGVQTTGENDISAFDFNRFKTYMEKVFIPMADYITSKGLYVVMRPPGVCPEKIEVSGSYHEYLKQVWGYVATQTALTDNPAVMFELANEPISILGTDGVYGSGGDACFEALSTFFQQIVDLMRSKGCDNILWVPGTGYQSQYAGFATHPVTGVGIGYAVHVYPGWYGSDAIEPSHELGGSYGGGYNSFQAGWDAQIAPCAAIAPIMVTEMDWAPSAYNASWGRSITGDMLGQGFGANFKVIADNTGNVSWMIFTGPEWLARFDASNPGQEGEYTFLNDPDACPWPVYHWFEHYATGAAVDAAQSVDICASVPPTGTDEYTLLTGAGMTMALIEQHDGYELNLTQGLSVDIPKGAAVKYADGRLYARYQGRTRANVEATMADGSSFSQSLELISTPFPLVEGLFNPSIWEQGTFDAATSRVQTGQWGFAGWTYPQGLDLSGYNYLVATITGQNQCGLSLRVFDKNNYWTSPATTDFGQAGRAVVDLRTARCADGSAFDPAHIYIAGFWSTGGAAFTLGKVYATTASDPGVESAISLTGADQQGATVYNLQGICLGRYPSVDEAVGTLSAGLYIINGNKYHIIK